MSCSQGQLKTAKTKEYFQSNCECQQYIHRYNEKKKEEDDKK